MHKIVGGVPKRKIIHVLSILFILLIAFTLIRGNYSLITEVEGRYFRKISTELISNQSQNASLIFIPSDTIRNHKFPIVISNLDKIPLYYNASWVPELLEISNPGGHLFWIDLDGLNEGEGSIQFYQEYHGEIVEFGETHNIKWSIPEISNQIPVQIVYETYSKNDFLLQWEYTLVAEIFDGYVNIKYFTSNENGPIANSMDKDGLAFPSFADLLTSINLDEAKRFQTWIYHPGIQAYDGGTNTYTLILWWEDNSFTKLDYHWRYEGDAIVTILSHDIIFDLERTIFDAAIEVMNNSTKVSSSSMLYPSSPYWLISGFALFRVNNVRRKNDV